MISSPKALIIVFWSPLGFSVIQARRPKVTFTSEFFVDAILPHMVAAKPALKTRSGGLSQLCLRSLEVLSWSDNLMNAEQLALFTRFVLASPRLTELALSNSISSSIDNLRDLITIACECPIKRLDLGCSRAPPARRAARTAYAAHRREPRYLRPWHRR
jgi:hypothetical protein